MARPMSPGRVLFSIALALSAPLMVSASDRTANLEARLLAAHNRERAALGVPPLAWDSALAADAASWAGSLARSGTFEHSQADTAQGENLWAGARGAWSPEEMIGAWIAEKRGYAPGVLRDSDVDKVGHYTQVIWRDTRKVGCALAPGRTEDVLVCRYARAGNVIGERAI